MILPIIEVAEVTKMIAEAFKNLYNLSDKLSAEINKYKVQYKNDV